MVVGILGATGYTGLQLLAHAVAHPNIQKIYASSQTHAGKTIDTVHTVLRAGAHSKKIHPVYLSPKQLQNKACSADNGERINALFSALPHGASAELLIPVATVNKNIVIIDLSADFRYSDAAIYGAVYGKDHADASMLKYAVYGLSEWNREHIKKARIIACPGCYPTSILLPLLPVLRYTSPTALISIVSTSGISGAGKTAEQQLMFCERTESVLPYAPGMQHRHASEIVHHLIRIAHIDDTAWQWHNHGGYHSTPVVFIPQLAPLARGMVSVITVPLLSGEVERAAQSITAQYAGEEMVTILTNGAMPDSAHVRGTNYAHIGMRCEESSLILCCAIDNLGKGAAGQAVQNFNIRFGLPESSGL